jgi:hypothetical protein
MIGGADELADDHDIRKTSKMLKELYEELAEGRLVG